MRRLRDLLALPAAALAAALPSAVSTTTAHLATPSAQ